MENATHHTEETLIESQNELQSQSVNPPLRRVGFLGVVLRLLVALGVLAGAAFFAFNSVKNKPAGMQRQARERSFTVAVDEITKSNYRPAINAYGEIVAANGIDIRAQVSGTAVAVSENLAVGGHVRAGELLVQIDPFNYELAILDMEAVKADAEIQLEVAREQLRIEQVNLDVSQDQLQLAQKDMERAEALVSQGSVTNKVVEDRRFLVTQRQQNVSQHQSNISVQNAGLQRLETSILRAEANIELAQRALANTNIVAPFDAVVVSAGAVTGRVISQNEVVAQLYQENKLDVRFTLSDSQYGQLVSAGLVGRDIEVIWDIDPEPLRAKGKVTRAGAQVNAALGGVEIFARLSDADLSNFRSGAFVSVKVEGLEYRDVFRVPETAIYENSHLYVVRDGRMARVELAILSRDGANVIIQADIASDEQVILTRVAQAGDGLKVRIEGETPAFGGAGGGPAAGGPNGAPAGGGRDGANPSGGAQNNQNQGNGERTDSRPAGGRAGAPGSAPSSGANAGANAGGGN